MGTTHVAVRTSHRCAHVMFPFFQRALRARGKKGTITWAHLTMHQPSCTFMIHNYDIFTFYQRETLLYKTLIKIHLIYHISNQQKYLQNSFTKLRSVFSLILLNLTYRLRNFDTESCESRDILTNPLAV